MRALNQTASGSHETANQIAQLSAQIEEIFKQAATSYLILQQVKEETLKYRPSKNLLQSLLKKHIETRLQDSRKLVIMFDSILSHSNIVSGVLLKVTNLPQELVLYNRYRGLLIVYSNKADSDEYFNTIQTKIVKDQPDASVIESNKKFRVIKFNLNAQLEKEFV
jgi:hypothetical protein